MIKKRRFPKIFPGWWIVLTSGVLNLWAGGFQFYGFSAMFKPISSELGFSRAVTSVAASIGRFEGGIEAPVTGWLTDRFGPKWIVLFGVSLLSLGLILMNVINSLWAFYLVWGFIVGTGANIVFSTALDTAIANWFVKKRGLAMGIKWVISGFSGVLVLPLIAWLVITRGWRMTCVIGGVIMGLIGLPITWFFVKQRRPEYYGLLPDGASAEEEIAGESQMIDRGVQYATEVQEVEFTLRQAMRTPAYWLLVVAQSAQSMGMSAIGIHGIPFLTDIGIEPLVAAGMISMMVLIGLPIRLFSGFLADRVKKNHLRFLLGGAYLLQAVGFSVFLLNQTITMIYVWFIIYGLANGVWYGVGTPMRARYFGRKAFGSITGISMAFMMPVGIAAPIYLGWVYDTTGSYISAFTLVAVFTASAAVIMSLALPPKPPAQITDIRKIV